MVLHAGVVHGVLPNAARYGAVLAVIRILTGIVWLIHGWGKISSPQWAAPNGNCARFLSDMLNGTSGPYHDFITGFVLPHITVFATLVAWGETLTGVALVVGLMTRLAGAIGPFLLLNYWLAHAGYADLQGYSGLEPTTALLTAINLVLPTGRVFGIDGMIAARKCPPAVGEKS